MRAVARFWSVLLLPLAAPAAAQVVPDAHTVPGGALRLSLSPRYLSWDEVFDTDGLRQPLGRFWDADSLGAGLFPAVMPVEEAVRRLTGDSTWRLSAGALRLNLDADVRRVPIGFQLGLTDRITFLVRVPIVNTTMNVTPRINADSANAGVPADAEGLMVVLAGLDAAADDVEARIADGEFGCPGSMACAEAEALVAEAREVRSQLAAALGGPFAPLADATAGQAIVARVAEVSAALEALGASAVPDTTFLPATPLDTAGLNTVLAAEPFGARPLETTKLRRRLGDVEVGLRLGIIRSPSVRTVVSTTVRFPTANRGRDDDLLDIAAGDRQLDVEWGLELAFEPGQRLALWLGGTYNLQLAGDVRLRVAPPTAPLAPASTLETVRWNPGDELRLSAYPSLRLTDRFRVFTTVAYYRKSADAYPEHLALNALTRVQRLSYGAGIWYRADANRRRATLPIEAGLIYRAAFSGEGGLAPVTRGVEFTLRLFYRLWGSAGAAAPPRAP